MGMGFVALRSFNTYHQQNADRNEKLQRKFINFVINSNFRLLVQGMNKLLEHHKQGKNDDLIDQN